MRQSFGTLAFAALCLANTGVSSSILFKGATIVGWDEDSASLDITRDGSLLVEDDKIAAIYAAGEEPGDKSTNSSDHEVVDATGKIITPGFIDTHAHRWQTVYRTMAPEVTLWQYFNRFGEFSSEALMTAEDIYIGQLMGLYEALNAGTTTTLDHAHHTFSMETNMAGLNASIETGARVQWAFAFHEMANYTNEDQVTDFKTIADSDIFDGTRTTLGVALDGLDDDEEWGQELAKLTLEYEPSVITIHALGGVFGISNKPSMVHSYGLLNTSIPVVFSHASYYDSEDIMLLRETDQYASITPESEMHFGHLHPNSHHFMDQASLGVDTHFTFSIDILTQARMWLQRVRATLFTSTMLDHLQVPGNAPMTADQAFLLATRNGGLALRRPDLGVIKVGATADLVVWDGESLPVVGWSDPVAAVMLHSSVGDIDHVVVGGEFKKRDKKLLVGGMDELKDRLKASIKRIAGEMDQIPWPAPEEGETWSSGAEVVDLPMVDVGENKTESS